ncbi:hypothetical protein ACFL2O_11755, partial [Thermodesulfobacteriota bacterium]
TKIQRIPKKHDTCRNTKSPKILEKIEFDSSVKKRTISNEVKKNEMTHLTFEPPFPKALLPPGETSMSGVLKANTTMKFEYDLYKPGRYSIFNHPKCLGYCWIYNSQL